VQEHGLPLAVGAEPQAERQRAISLYFGVKSPLIVASSGLIRMSMAVSSLMRLAPF